MDVERLRQAVAYDPLTGELTWRERPVEHFRSMQEYRRWNGRYAGRPAFGFLRFDGYLAGTFDGISLLAHRVAWAVFSGAWPDEIDHADGIRSNNRVANLRDVSRRVNMRNKARYRTSRSGHGGVRFSEAKRGWEAWVEKCYLGLWDTSEEAQAARMGALKALNYHSNHDREPT